MAATKFREIAEHLVREITLLPPGSRIEGEHEVAARFGVGRAAARAALQELERRLLVCRVRGVGTFTARRIDYLVSPDQPPSWSRTVRAAHSRPRTVVRRCETVPMPPEVAGPLGREPGSPCHRLQRRSFVDELPACWGTEWVPADVLPELGVALGASDSLDRILRESAGATPRRAWWRAALECASAETAAELGSRAGDPAWLVESLNEDVPSGRLLYLSHRWLRADTVRLVLETGGTPGPRPA
ncbi:GntR family transcriptional regulator [Streptomyces avicenniae]|uniref:GntR family transcriptional regulator n=1 Tax=Streptomyces avicenniae TaxID=500153 RepID=UPI00069CAD81|nr:GntR family transcriptional regulator [Streptomyces avicenniae]